MAEQRDSPKLIIITVLLFVSVFGMACLANPWLWPDCRVLFRDSGVSTEVIDRNFRNCILYKPALLKRNISYLTGRILELS